MHQHERNTLPLHIRTDIVSIDATHLRIPWQRISPFEKTGRGFCGIAVLSLFPVGGEPPPLPYKGETRLDSAYCRGVVSIVSPGEYPDRLILGGGMRLLQNSCPILTEPRRSLNQRAQCQGTRSTLGQASWLPKAAT